MQLTGHLYVSLRNKHAFVMKWLDKGVMHAAWLNGEKLEEFFFNALSWQHSSKHWTQKKHGLTQNRFSGLALHLILNIFFII